MHGLAGRLYNARSPTQGQLNTEDLQSMGRKETKLANIEETHEKAVHCILYSTARDFRLLPGQSWATTDANLVGLQRLARTEERRACKRLPIVFMLSRNLHHVSDLAIISRSYELMFTSFMPSAVFFTCCHVSCCACWWCCCCVVIACCCLGCCSSCCECCSCCFLLFLLFFCSSCCLSSVLLLLL